MSRKIAKAIYSVVALAMVLGSVFAFSAPKALAAPAYDYALVNQSAYPSTLNAGDVTNVWIEVKNTGTATWGSNVRLGAGSAYGSAAQGRDYSSEFANSDWPSANRAAGMTDGTRAVAGIIPGWNVRFQFNIKAPSTAGVYKAYFTPVADGVTWMKDIGIFWQITVAGTSGGGTVTPPPVVAGALNATIDGSTPAAQSIVADGTNGGQALASLAAFNFSGAGTVTQIKLNRIGVSSDSNLDNVYLYDGISKIAEMNSISNGVITFLNSNGLFTINGTKVITVKADINKGTSAGQTIGVSITSAASITSNATSVGGTFPASGNYMTVATVSNLGKLTVADVSSSTSVDPGQTGFEVWKFSLTSANQNVSVKYIKLTQVGSIATADLTNIKLYDGSTQLGSTVAALGTDNTAVFDLASAPLVINSGNIKNISVKADIVGGTSRSFRFTIQRSADVVVSDNNYNVSLTPIASITGVAQTAWAVVGQGSLGSADGTSTTINTGTLTAAVASDTPSGNIALSSTGITLGKFNFTAAGEDVKLSSIVVNLTGSTLTNAANMLGLQNGQLVMDGSQIGTTQTLADSGNTTFTLNYTVPKGTTKTLLIKADIVGVCDTVANVGCGAAYAVAATDTILANVVAGSGQGQTSLSTISYGAASGRLLTVATGVLTIAKNAALADGTTANPTAVKGATNVKIGSFVVTAGASEGVSISQFGLKYDALGALVSGALQNLRLMNGSAQIGSTQGTLSATNGTTYYFSPSSSISLAAGGQLVVDVYADILSSTTASNYKQGDNVYPFYLDSVTATGAVTNTNSGLTGQTVASQKLVISAAGTLTISQDSSTPQAQQLAMGASNVTLAVLKFTASAAEDVNVNKIILEDVSAVNGAVTNIGLYDGASLIGTTVSSFGTISVAGFTPNSGVVGGSFSGIVWNLGSYLTVPKGSYKNITVKANVNSYPNVASASVTTIKLNAGAVSGYGAGSGASISSAGAGAGLSMTIYKSLLNVGLASDSPAGTRTVSASDTVAKFTITNPTVGNDATLKKITLAIAGTAVAATTVHVYDSTNMSTELTAGGTAYAGATNHLITFDSDLTITGGSSKTLVIVLDSSGFATGTKSFTASIGTTATDGIAWSDGVAGSGTLTANPANNLPLNANTLTY
ncbi:MAG TPA: hypothetical protein P5096_02340 [Patescibacteria group bacterium]|nr:hypothetical protein [Patescibacteria group bacterium]